MSRLVFCLLAWGACLQLSGCLAPEKFSASLHFETGNTYVYRYSGTVADAGALAGMAEDGHLGTAAEDKLRALAQEMNEQKENGLVRFEYAGKARYTMESEEQLKIGEESRFAPFLMVEYVDGGAIEVRAAQSPSQGLDRQDDMIRAIGLQPEGLLQITVPDEATVIEQNADSVSGGSGQTYEWKITNLEKLPRIVFRMPGHNQ